MGTGYELHLHPPAYPERMRPWSCRHERDNPGYVMCADTRIERRRGRNVIEIDHQICLACGTPRPCTVGGNILLDLWALRQELGWHAEIGARIDELLNRYGWFAVRLFGRDGWNGRHERIARLIDPWLTMRLEGEAIKQPAASARPYWYGTATFDPSYFGEAA